MPEHWPALVVDLMDRVDQEKLLHVGVAGERRLGRGGLDSSRLFLSLQQSLLQKTHEHGKTIRIPVHLANVAGFTPQACGIWSEHVVGTCLDIDHNAIAIEGITDNVRCRKTANIHTEIAALTRGMAEEG